MIHGVFQATIDAPWLTMTGGYAAGALPSGLGTPAIYVTVERDGAPMLRIDLYEGEAACYAFQDVVAGRTSS